MWVSTFNLWKSQHMVAQTDRAFFPPSMLLGMSLVLNEVVKKDHRSHNGVDTHLLTKDSFSKDKTMSQWVKFAVLRDS